MVVGEAQLYSGVGGGGAQLHSGVGGGGAQLHSSVGGGEALYSVVGGAGGARLYSGVGRAGGAQLYSSVGGGAASQRLAWGGEERRRAGSDFLWEGGADICSLDKQLHSAEADICSLKVGGALHMAGNTETGGNDFHAELS